MLFLVQLAMAASNATLVEDHGGDDNDASSRLRRLLVVFVTSIELALFFYVRAARSSLLSTDPRLRPD